MEIPERGARHVYPLLVSASLLVLVVAAATFVVVKRLGQFGYIIDDGYIHLSVARNLVRSGTWGVIPATFSAASSSLLWTCLLSLVLWAGTGWAAWLPLVLSLFSALGVLTVSALVLRTHGISAPLALVSLAAMVFVTPLTTLVLMGMEHALHLCLFIGFAHFAIRVLHTRPAKARDGWWLVLLGVLMAATRYEGLFAVAAAALFLLVQGRWRLMLLVTATALLPMAAFGLYSVWQGGAFVPNSLLMKGDFRMGSLADWARFGLLLQHQGFRESTALLETALLLAVGYFAPRTDDNYRRRTRTWTWLWFGTVVVHLQFARIHSGMQRYEAYLVGSGLLILTLVWGPAVSRLLGGAGPWLRAQRARGLPTALLILLAIFSLWQPYIGRAVAEARFIPQLSQREFDRNHMSGRFIREFYRDRTVAICDLGATSWLADSRLIDLWGLGTLDVTRAYRSNRFGAAWAAAYCAEQHVEIAILHDIFVQGRLNGVPPGWTLVGSWHVLTMEGPAIVRFYAVAPGSAARLAENLARWRDRLSPRVRLELSAEFAGLEARGLPGAD